MEPMTVAILASVGASLLKAFTSDNETPRTEEDKFFGAQVARFKKLREKREAAMNAASIVSGRPKESFSFGKSDIWEKYKLEDEYNQGRTRPKTPEQKVMGAATGAATGAGNKSNPYIATPTSKTGKKPDLPPVILGKGGRL